VVVREGAQNSVKRAHLGLSTEGERARETRSAHLSLTFTQSAREVEVLKRDGVGEGNVRLGGILHLFTKHLVLGNVFPSFFQIQYPLIGSPLSSV
jgi:hypothetical protein